MRKFTLYLFLVVFVVAGAAVAQNDAGLSSSVVKKIKKRAKKYDVNILRDTWGVPHIFGKTDPDASFGLAYAHAEDDFSTIQDALIATRALGASVNGPDAGVLDFMVHLLGTWDVVNAKYETDLAADTRALCEGYADGLNYYAVLHAEELKLDGLLPFTGKDIVAGFVFRGPFFYGLDGDLKELFGPERKHQVSTKRASRATEPTELIALGGETLPEGIPTGSNTFSVSPKRSADGKTYININSHQPWEGPVAWYEAHVVSEDGWDMVGSTFPGSPIILHGHNRFLGWAHTVNKPDLVDIYVLTMNPEDENQYRYDGEWRDLEVSEVTISVKVTADSNMTMKVRREVLRSVHGPVLRQDHGVYALRYAGMEEVRAVEQWYRMNKARNLDEWMEAMRMRAIPSLNCGYADNEGNILYLYNAQIPVRDEAYDWQEYLPGDTSEVVWTEYEPFDALPMVLNPASGFVQNCNSTPFKTTTGPGNPDPAKFSHTFGIETNMTNRALRAMELLGADDSITEQEFKDYKFDMKYSEESFVAEAIKTLLSAPTSDNLLVQEAMKILKDWDLSTAPDNRGAALAIMTVRPHFTGTGLVPEADVMIETLAEVAQALKDKHGRIDVAWSEVNRLRRGSVDVGLGGGPDVLHAVYGSVDEDTAQYVGRAGDSYVMLVNWDKDGKVSSQSIHQYGSATLDETSPHYADQVPLFINRELKPVWIDEAEIRAHLESEYRPGRELSRD